MIAKALHNDWLIEAYSIVTMMRSLKSIETDKLKRIFPGWFLNTLNKAYVMIVMDNVVILKVAPTFPIIVFIPRILLIKANAG